MPDFVAPPDAVERLDAKRGSRKNLGAADQEWHPQATWPRPREERDSMAFTSVLVLAKLNGAIEQGWLHEEPERTEP